LRWQLTDAELFEVAEDLADGVYAVALDGVTGRHRLPVDLAVSIAPHARADEERLRTYAERVLAAYAGGQRPPSFVQPGQALLATVPLARVLRERGECLDERFDEHLLPLAIAAHEDLGRELLATLPPERGAHLRREA
jgi:hypothetical protein